ncbi:MAG: FtsW/RodA/SpoVE family cell cycle protein, partial [Nakamurella sp.]
LGVGLGQSRAKWSYLPNADSDFIFAIVGEELGLIGAGVLLLLFGLLAYTGLRIARRNVDPFVKIVASGCTVWLVGQAGINIGYVVGLLPVTGIPLPMISSGGTSLLITMVVFGLLANFARRETQAAAALHAGGGSRLARFLGIGSADPAGRRPGRRRQRGSAAKIGKSGKPRQATADPASRARPGGRSEQRGRGPARPNAGAAWSAGRAGSNTNPAGPQRRPAGPTVRSQQPGGAQARRDPRQPPSTRGSDAPVDPRVRRLRRDGA